MILYTKPPVAMQKKFQKKIESITGLLRMPKKTEEPHVPFVLANDFLRCKREAGIKNSRRTGGIDAYF